jgi:tetratricopeptide (TPR) repeat protein
VETTVASAEAANPDPAQQSRQRLVNDYLQRGDALHSSGRYEEAAEAYLNAHQLDRGNWHALAGRNRAVRRHVPRWHFEMMHDDERAELYEKALRQVVSADKLVLDIGTGSGLLAMMAARAGAGQVVACEGQAMVADVARKIVKTAGFADKVTVVPKMSTVMEIGQDLDRRADVLVTETVDCGLLGEGILATIAHAREHLLADGAVIVPARARVLAGLIESPELFRKNHVGELYGFDLSGFNELASMEYFDSRLRRHEHRMLTEPFDVFNFDFYRDGPEGKRTELTLKPTVDGTCHAVVFWFELELVAGIELTNSPEHPNTHWKQAIQCLTEPVRLTRGQPVPVDVRHDGLHIHFTVGGSTQTSGAQG